MTVDLSWSIGTGGKQELRFRNPVMVASGTFSNGLEFAKRFDVDALGALVSKGTTLQPRRGNQPVYADQGSGRRVLRSLRRRRTADAVDAADRTGPARLNLDRAYATPPLIVRSTLP